MEDIRYTIGDLLVNIILLIGMIMILLYIMRKEEKRQVILENRYNRLTITAIESIKNYSDRLVSAIYNIPNKQNETLERMSQDQLRQTGLILEELKIINNKFDENIKKREEFHCLLKDRL